MPVRVIFDNIVELFEQYFFGIIIDLLESKYLLRNSSSGVDLNIDYVKSQKPDCLQKSFEKVSYLIPLLLSTTITRLISE